ncbi:MAG: hypothetical protein WBA74_10275 [Cyclobacteriaceae bacterium]
MDNTMELWNSVSCTDKEYTKEDYNGNWEYTKINPTYQTMKATQEWGSFGGLWGVTNPLFNNIKLGEVVKTVRKGDVETITSTILLMCEYKATFYYPGGKFNIEASRQITFEKGEVDQYYIKSVVTDAVTKGLSKLGFSADIYMQKYDAEKEPKRESKGLQSYKDVDSKKIIEDPFDKPPIEPVNLTGEPKVKVIKEEPKLKIVREIDKQFIDAIEKSNYSEEKKKELLNNPNISDIIKKGFIKGKEVKL